MRTETRVPSRGERTNKRPGLAHARVAVVSVVVAGCLVATQGAAYAAPQQSPAAEDTEQSVNKALATVGIKVRSDGWIEYRSLLGRVGVSGKTSRVAGVREQDGGCTLPGSDKASDSDQTTYVEEVAYNPATCEFDVAVANLTSAQTATMRSLDGATSSGVTSEQGATDGVSKDNTETVTTLASTYARYLKTSWIDPINITISSQKVGLRWSGSRWLNWAYKRDSFKGCVSGVCLDKTYIVSGSDSLSTLSNGWTKTASVHFRNTSFALWVVGILGAAGWAACGFPTSSQADFYHKDSVTGRKSGASSWSWSDSKSGACTNLVHHGTETGASYPF